MKQRLTYAAAVAVLLFVGGGCAATQQTELKTYTPTPGASADVKMEVKAGDEVDAAVEGILTDAGEEQQAQKEQEGDASELEADKAELNAYSEGSYEVK